MLTEISKKSIFEKLIPTKKCRGTLRTMANVSKFLKQTSYTIYIDSNRASVTQEKYHVKYLEELQITNKNNVVQY